MSELAEEVMTSDGARSDSSSPTSVSRGVGLGNEIVPGIRQWRLLGSGHRFEMWLAWSVDRWSPVCIKIPRADVDTDHTRAALAREADNVGRLTHPYIQRLLEANLDADQPHLVYEYVEGATLRHSLKVNEFDPRTVAILGMQIAASLHYIHGMGLVHYDVKPGNLVERSGRMVLLDFDLAMPIGAVSAGPLPRGTPAYMAPEQIRCEPAAPSMDLFALGIVLYKTATGTAPFPSTKDDDGNRVYPQLTSQPPPVGDLAPSVEAPQNTFLSG